MSEELTSLCTRSPVVARTRSSYDPKTAVPLFLRMIAWRVRSASWSGRSFSSVRASSNDRVAPRIAMSVADVFLRPAASEATPQTALKAGAAGWEVRAPW